MRWGLNAVALDAMGLECDGLECDGLECGGLNAMDGFLLFTVVSRDEVVEDSLIWL